MGKVILGMTMSLDGFINDQNGSVSRLYPDLAELQKTEMLQESIKTTGAVVMGRRAYDMAGGTSRITNFKCRYLSLLMMFQKRWPKERTKG